jgi:hypothetical protein
MLAVIAAILYLSKNQLQMSIAGVSPEHESKKGASPPLFVIAPKAT